MTETFSNKRMEEMARKLDELIWMFNGNEPEENYALLGTLVDIVAEQNGKHGYELLEELLPISKQVYSDLGSVL